MAPVQNAMIGNNQANNVNQAGPNIIGNVEDYSNVQLVEEEETPILGGVDVQMEQPLDEEGSKYKDISNQLKRTKRNRGKSPFWHVSVKLFYLYDNLKFILFKIHVSTKRNFFARKKHSGRLWSFWKRLQ